jgi:hypothetical protein
VNPQDLAREALGKIFCVMWRVARLSFAAAPFCEKAKKGRDFIITILIIPKFSLFFTLVNHHVLNSRKYILSESCVSVTIMAVR